MCTLYISVYDNWTQHYVALLLYFDQNKIYYDKTKYNNYYSYVIVKLS